MIQQLGYGVSGNIGVLGISDGVGGYIYYPNYTTAFASAKSGDTIVQFANIVEYNLVGINLKNGVTINLNGFTYEFKRGVTFTDNNVAISCSIINGKFYSSVVSSISLFIIYNASSIITTNCTFEATTSSIAVVQCVGTWNGGTFNASSGYAISTGLSSSDTYNGVIINAYVNGSATTASQNAGSGTYRNCIVTGAISCLGTVNITNCFALQLGMGNGTILTTYNCVIIVASNVIALRSTDVRAVARHNNLIVISTVSASGIGLAIANQSFYNCYLYSGVAPLFVYDGSPYGIGVNYGQLNNFYNCTLVTPTSTVLGSYNDKLINCTVDCQWNNSLGHAVQNALLVNNCYIKVANVNAKCLNSSTITNTTYNGFSSRLVRIIGNLQTSS